MGYIYNIYIILQIKEAWPSIAANGQLKRPNPPVVFDTPSNHASSSESSNIPSGNHGGYRMMEPTASPDPPWQTVGTLGEQEHQISSQESGISTVQNDSSQDSLRVTILRAPLPFSNTHSIFCTIIRIDYR